MEFEDTLVPPTSRYQCSVFKKKKEKRYLVASQLPVKEGAVSRSPAEVYFLVR